MSPKPPYALLDGHPIMRVFPILCGNKYPPLLDDNLRRASRDRDQITKWAKRYPGCNWGLALAASELIVLDVDTRDGKRGKLTLAELELKHGPLPRTLTVRTPSGGLHFYFSETDTVKHRMRVSAFGPDVDSTNYVLLPGGMLLTGGSYEVIDGDVYDLIQPAPEWFAEYLAPKISDNSDGDQTPAVDLDQKQNIARAIHFLKNDAKPSIMGRNGEYRLLMTAATLKDIGISKDTAIELLNEYYNVPGKCEPQWSIGEGATADRLDVKVGNAWQYLKKTQPGANSAAADFGDDVPEIADNEADDAIRLRNATKKMLRKVYGRSLRSKQS